MKTTHKKKSGNTKVSKKTKIESIAHTNLDRAGEIAWYYGFQPMGSLDIKKIDSDKAKNFIDYDFLSDCKGYTAPLHVEEKIALLRTYHENKFDEGPQPTMLYFKDSHHGSKQTRYADLQVIGPSRSIAEATLIQTARLILESEGYDNIMIEINSMGDKESLGKFSRNLTAYYRKHIGDMPNECRQLFKKDPFLLLSYEHEVCDPINARAPQAIHFLSETSRQHFKEVLEFIEALDIPYTINNALIGNRTYCSDTIFEIIDMNHADSSRSDRVLGLGFRYDGLAKKIGSSRDIQGVGITLLNKRNKKSSMGSPVAKTKKPWVYFMQLGFDAKLLSLQVIEVLRKAKIPVYQSLPKDKMAAQVSVAEKLRIPYSIIMGKMEAVQKSVLIRQNTTRSQVVVPISELAEYMKKLEKELFG